MFGLAWPSELKKQGLATEFQGDGYPLEFSATAAALIPRLPNDEWIEREKLVLAEICRDETDGWLERVARQNIEFAPEVIAACEPSEWLIVQAWDRS